MSPPSTSERRARLAAERLLALRERTLGQEAARLEARSKALLDEIRAKRAELLDLRQETDRLRLDHEVLRAHAEREVAAAQSSERNIWAALQTLRDGFAIYDRDHRLVVANRAYLSVFEGLNEIRPGVTHRRVCEILVEEGIADPGPDPRGWIERCVDRWSTNPIPSATLELWNGQMIKLIERHLPDGGVVTLAVNQTEMQRVMAAIEAIPDGFVLYDRDDRLVMCNQTYRDLYRLDSLAEGPGVSFIDVLRHGLELGYYAEAAGREEDWLEERLDQHNRATGESTEQRLADGRWLRILEQKTPDGGTAGLRIDITDLKRQQQDLLGMNEAAEAARRAKAAFLSNMSHEIRTPINGIVGLSQVLLDGALSEEQRGFASTLRRSATALLTIVDDVLDFSRSESGLLDLRVEPFDAVRLLDDAVEGFRAVCRQRGLALELVCEGVPRACEGDVRRVRQILMNLIGNAVKFTRQGHVTVRATGAPDGPDGPGRVRLTIEVEDSGIGVPPDRAPHIFGGFVQAEASHDRSHDGSGLGLAICRRLVELMEGEIGYRPRDGGGSVFFVVLPLALAQIAAPADAGRLEPAATRIDPSVPLRILAADDNATNRLILKKLLEPLGVSLAMAATGADAVRMAAEDPPDLVLMDISMPGMDGKEATALIRTAERAADRPALPIVAMTAHALAEDIAEIRRAGIDDVLTKPLSREALARRIEIVRDAGQAAAAAALRKKAGASGAESAGA